MLREIDINEVPSFSLVRERIRGINPNVEFVKAGLDRASDTYVLRLQLATLRHTDLRLSKELLDDLTGGDVVRREAELDRLSRSALERIK